MGPQIRLKNLQLSIRTNFGRERPEMESDRCRILQCLISMLSNSVKFCFTGSVSLVVRKTVKEDVNLIKFTITDTGIGMSSETKARLFKEPGMEPVKSSTS